MGKYTALNDLIRFVERNNGTKYIYKTDISNYGDSIDKEKLLEILKLKIDSHSSLFLLIKKFIYAQYIESIEGESQPIKGIPTGAALTPIFENIYMGSIDLLFQGKDNCFYGRYGDDIILVSPCQEAIKQGEEAIQNEVKKLNLTIKPEKEEYYIANKLRPLYFEWLGIAFDQRLNVTSRKKYFIQFKKVYKHRLNLLLTNLSLSNTEKCFNIIFSYHFKMINPFLTHETYRLLSHVESDLFVKLLDQYLWNYLVRMTSRRLNISRREVWKKKRQLKKRGSLNYYRRLVTRKEREKKNAN